MSFQAVTGVSTNAPSVSGEARPRPRARGWCPEGLMGQGSEALAAEGPWDVVPSPGVGARSSGVWMQWRPLSQTVMETFLPHTAVWERRKGFNSLPIYNSLRE